MTEEQDHHTSPKTGLVAWLNRAAGGDFEDPPPDPARRVRKLQVVVASTAFFGLMLEILLARMYPFFLGDVSAFIAIPVAMFGLSLGALTLHWFKRDVSARALPLLVPLLLVVTLVALLGFFALFDHVFSLTHHWRQDFYGDALKTVALTAIFLPSFAITGIILSTAFTAGARQVGRLYALDLIGSAGACLVAPLALRLVDLPLVICLLLAALGAAVIAMLWARRNLVVGVVMPVLLLLIGLAANQWVFTEHPDPKVLAGKYSLTLDATELRHRWNEVSRVAVLEIAKEGRRTRHRLVHDDGISTVGVKPYDDEWVRKPPKLQGVYALPFLLDETPSTALVMFAGCGKDMVHLYEYSRGELAVTGVEINPLIKKLVSHGRWNQWNLRAFYELPDVDLVTEEGRGFLNRDRNSYDVIFVANNGPMHATRTGHSRKFLDTTEAMEAYLDHLAPGGTIVFASQPRVHKDEIFKRLLAQRDSAGRPSAPYPETVMVFGRRPYRHSLGLDVDSWMIKPSGFSASEVRRVRQFCEGQWSRKTHYVPIDCPKTALVPLIEAPIDPDAFVPNDDQPFERRVEFADFELFPERRQLDSVRYSLNWIKIFTMVFFGLLALITIGAFYGRRRGPRRMPVWLAGYFLLSGVCYMCAQIGLMAKLELFMGNPLYSIAVVLASFLLFNGLGSAFAGRRQDAGQPLPVWLLALGAAVAVPLTLLLVDGVLVHLLGLALVLRALLALVTVAPLAFVLGMFYPTGVKLALDRDLQQLVPMTFGLATLSSVLGSTWAIVAVINYGFRGVILQGEVGYLALAIVAAVAVMAGDRSSSR